MSNCSQCAVCKRHAPQGGTGRDEPAHQAEALQRRVAHSGCGSNRVLAVPHASLHLLTPPPTSVSLDGNTPPPAQ